jgi:superfamily I DNA and/or RNA helicase
MLPHIGAFISDLFYGGTLEHHRQQGNGPFADFGWLTYQAPGYQVPAQSKGEDTVLINQLEIEIIQTRLRGMHQQLQSLKVEARLTVAVITPYRAQCQELKRVLPVKEWGKYLAIEIDTVDAFQGRQADIVFFSFVRTVGPATFYADDRRLNVAISRARDCVYLVGDIRYIGGKRLPALQKLAQLPVVHLHQLSDKTPVKHSASGNDCPARGKRSRMSSL